MVKVDKRRKVTPEIIKRMQHLRGEGLTYMKISDKLGLSYLTVYKYLKKEGKAGKEEEIKKEERGKAEEEVVKEEPVKGEKVGFFGRLKAKLGF